MLGVIGLIHYGHIHHMYIITLTLQRSFRKMVKPDEIYVDEINVHDWNDYDMGAIFGVKLKDNLGVIC